MAKKTNLTERYHQKREKREKISEDKWLAIVAPHGSPTHLKRIKKVFDISE